jgi:birA, biotin-[acetyl-CoA-carboxylase] ligase region
VVDYSALKLPDGVECFVLESTTSTNDYLTKLPFSEDITVCIAREQTAGKGQYQRAWLSKKDSSVLLSLRYPFSMDTGLNGLSLVVGLSIVDVLKNDYGIENLKLKWPNDLYFEDRKLAGILIENSVQSNTQSVVIGLGLNHHLGKGFKCEAPWIDLSQILSNTPNLEQLSVKFINKIIHYCRMFELKGFDNFQSLWHEYDYLVGRSIELDYQNKKITGIAKGVSDKGALLIESNDSIIEAYSSEQISLI